MTFQIDLNCDLGESFGCYTIGEQAAILRYVSSANIACGFHAGDPTVMRKTVQLALAHNVKIGAHPGLPDLIGFGRREMAITPEEAYDMTLYQIGALQGVVTACGTTLQHVKPHGALYNMAARDAALAQAIAQAIYDISPQLILFGLAASELTKAGELLGLRTAHEVFADRTYQADGTLTSRRQSDALITDEHIAIQQMIRFIKEGKVRSQQGTDIALRADTICIHGDSPHAVAFARAAQQALAAQHITIQAISR